MCLYLALLPSHLNPKVRGRKRRKLQSPHIAHASRRRRILPRSRRIHARRSACETNPRYHCAARPRAAKRGEGAHRLGIDSLHRSGRSIGAPTRSAEYQ